MSRGGRGGSGRVGWVLRVLVVVGLEMLVWMLEGVLMSRRYGVGIGFAGIVGAGSGELLIVVIALR